MSGLLLLAAGTTTSRAEVVEIENVNYINDPGNPSDGLGFLDMSFSVGLSLSAALAKAHLSYPTARLATPSEFDDLLSAAGIIYSGLSRASDGFKVGVDEQIVANGSAATIKLVGQLGGTIGAGETLIWTDPDGSSLASSTRDIVRIDTFGPDGSLGRAFLQHATFQTGIPGTADYAGFLLVIDPAPAADPRITSLSPLDGATGVMALDTLVATFDETLVIGSGNITLKNLTDATESTIDITDTTQVSLADNVLTIRPTSPLMSETDYAVQIAAGVVSDISGNAFNGILDDVTWNFTTGTYPNLLFADTFDRPNSTDLNESAAGKAGTLGALTWGSGNLQSLIDINNNAMRINNNDSDGNDGSWAWVEHNFAGLGEFTVSLDIATQSSGGDGRYAGFRIGQSLDDISGETSSSVGGNAADVQIYLDNIGSTRGIRVFEGPDDRGYVVSFTSGIGELSATFTCANTNAGTTLDYEIFLNGLSQYVGSTAWSGTDENYISVQSNSTNDTRFDSFVVTGTPAGPGDYETWAGLYPGANLGDPNGDFDGDGLSNDAERLFGLDPTSPASVNPISVPLDAAAGTFSFTRRDAALTGVFTSVETSTDLVTWTLDSGAMLTAADPDANGTQTVDVVLSQDLLLAPTLFVRIVLGDGGSVP